MKFSRLNQLLATLFLATVTQRIRLHHHQMRQQRTKWSGNNYTVRASSVGFPVGSGAIHYPPWSHIGTAIPAT